mmetsp:Transcript_28481/g.48451  ORF Transcript_28481/g.48451 Transcript_28481/m.48451 type:complete len:153 (+) Transcript_28481:336-794(+)
MSSQISIEWQYIMPTMHSMCNLSSLLFGSHNHKIAYSKTTYPIYPSIPYPASCQRNISLTKPSILVNGPPNTAFPLKYSINSSLSLSPPTFPSVTCSDKIVLAKYCLPYRFARYSFRSSGMSFPKVNSKNRRMDRSGDSFHSSMLMVNNANS